MMKIIIIMIFFSCSFASAIEEKTYDARGLSLRERLSLIQQIKEENKPKIKNPNTKAQEFFEELKAKGSPALDSLQKESMMEDETTNFIDKEMNKTVSRTSGVSKIKQSLSAKDGEVKSYKKVGDDNVMLNGTYHKTRYLIEYKNGKTQSVEMLYIRPTVSGEYILTEFTVE